ncbi:ATP synthase subunit E containing protein, putative [Babesia bigemina]|uniref:ATP synthase subunit E containing protein, putative n=1 Tax=Babesia bigemina TaxID=5866 RepID=A0A061D697_BABBI|nr:ATP synthase subunit E containing protein, putative [Babesia bigemina]CDR96216.1 ATP synthase subunit E containing protein, putative [Babesia bigemina]|eukprot:XP_012768402.1 ATP synthase subunit E containing protein, putative [Babesia bigemina]
MVNFILNEAKDKAEEIESTAVEDFNVQKMTLFQQKKDEIRAKLTKKINGLKLEKIRTYNAASREIHDRVLRHKCSIIDNIKSDALQKIKEQISVADEYKRIIVLLIIKGLMSLACNDVLVRCRKEDVTIVKSSIGDAKLRFATLVRESVGAKLELTAEVDTNTYLSSDNIGVVVTTSDGKVECDCTLNSRLDICCEKLIPKFKTALFKR